MDFPQQFGKYTLLRRLATGGMAEIFLARQAGVGGFEKEVVVKRLLPVHAANQEFVAMFLDEARIAANLTHPNIAQIFDLGQEGDDYYIAMEYVRGTDLRRVCSQGIAEGNYLPLHHAVRIIAEVCDALFYAHTRTDKDGRPLNIVHRDISPTNILVTFDGGVKLVDFGIAKAANKVSVTKVGQIKGKYGYMSPEQCRGDVIDARSDIFAAGINLYEVTLGRRLFRGDSDIETIRAIESCAIAAPRSVSPDFPERLEKVVLAALSRDPNDRYGNARELQMALEDFLAEASLRATAGMLAEYMRQLFRDQLALEAGEGSGVRTLPRVLTSPAAASPESDGPSDVAPLLNEIETPSEADESPGLSDSAELMTSARPESESAAPKSGVESLTDEAVVDRSQMQITRLPEALRRPAQPPSLPASLSAEPSVDDLMILQTPSIEFIGDGSGISAPIDELLRKAENPVTATPPMRTPPASRAEASAMSSAPTQPPRPASTGFNVPVTEVDERDILVRGPRRYTTGLLFLLLVVTLLFGIQYLFVEDGARMNARRTPVSMTAALPPAQTVLGTPSPNASEPPSAAPPKLGILRIDSLPAGARVVVNGNMLNSTTPASIQTFSDAKSTVRVLLASYLPWETRVDVSAAGTDVKATLQKGKPDLGKLLIETAPAGAKIWINGAEVGVSPTTLEKVGAGMEMTMRLEKEGHHPHAVLFTLQKGEERAVGINLIPDTGPKSMSVVNIESIPLGATIFDGFVEGGKRPLGKTGNYALKVNRAVDSGLRLRAELAGHEPVERDLDVKLPYYTVYLRFAEPEKQFGALTLGGAPNITVYLGAQELGVTPLKAVKVPVGEHAVVLLDAATGKRSEVSLKVEKGAALERTVKLGEGGAPALE